MVSQLNSALLRPHDEPPITNSTDVLGEATYIQDRYEETDAEEAERGRWAAALIVPRQPRAATSPPSCSSRRGVAPTEDTALDMLTRLLRRTHVAGKLSLPVPRAFHSSPALRAIDMAKVDTTERLGQLRKLMKERNVDIYSTYRSRAGAAEI
jgi:hypothetical protein